MNDIIIVVSAIVLAVLLVIILASTSINFFIGKTDKEKELINLKDEQLIMPIAETEENIKENEQPVAEDTVVSEPVVEEPVVEEEPAVEEVKEEPVVEAETPADEEIKEDIVSEPVVEEPKNEEQEGSLIQKDQLFFDTDVMYSRSFKAKTIQTSDETKEYYSELKNELLSYKGIKARTSWDKESFNIGRKFYARMTIKGKTLMLYLALNPKEYLNTKYLVEDVSDVSKYSDVPTLYRIKGDRRLNYAKELIAIALEGIEKMDREPVSYIYPFEETNDLIEKGLIKIKEVSTKRVIIKAQVDANEVATLISDEDAEKAKIVVKKDVNPDEEIEEEIKKEIVNTDDLSNNFKANELVTLKKLIEKGIVSEDTNYIKILARGILDKPLRVEANDFSVDAVKMITVTGGQAIQVK